MAWQISIADDIGGRRQQQDRLAAMPMYGDSSHLLVLADGMGGQRGGADAAQEVVNTALRYAENADIGDPDVFLQSICLDAHNSIAQWRDPGRPGPGSTCVLLYLLGPEAYWTHVGDSRLCYIRNGELIRQTLDHSLSALQITQGKQSTNPRSVLYMCLGGSSAPQPCHDALAVEADDLVVLCSDGFWEHVTVEETVTCVEKHGLCDTVADELVQLACERGGNRADNISLALAQWREETASTQGGLFRRLRFN